MSRLMYYDEEAHQFFPMPDEQPELMRSTTNADRIRAMSDEEMAELMHDATWEGRKTVEEPEAFKTVEEWLDWLREEAPPHDQP